MTLEQIYSKIPKLECRQQCHAFCGPVIMSLQERDRIKAITGLNPFKISLCRTCPCLDPITHTCNVYAVRPLICRLWGTVKRLACPHGCQPERWLSDVEADQIIAEYRKAGLTHGFADPNFFKIYGYGRGLSAKDFKD